MAVSDTVVGNLTTLYLAVIAAMKAYGLIMGQSYTGVFVLVASTAVVGVLLVATLTWDVSRKATYYNVPRAANGGDAVGSGGVGGGGEMCKGGICWHGVAVKSPASQVLFRLPQQPPFHP